jgi:hypothetical protein
MKILNKKIKIGKYLSYGEMTIFVKFNSFSNLNKSIFFLLTGNKFTPTTLRSFQEITNDIIYIHGNTLLSNNNNFPTMNIKELIEVQPINIKLIR